MSFAGRPYPAERRDAEFDEIETTTYDVCVIGGGATGAGCALDAQTRGLRTLLIEAGDFASATSSTSTKLVHGGVRYLQQAFNDRDLGQYRVVARALAERATMLANAPYLAHTLENIIPCYSWFDIAYYAIGLRAYDLVAGRRNLFGSRILSARATQRKLPRVRPTGLRGGVLYADGQFDDARYNTMLALTAADAGASMLTYVAAVDFGRTAAGRIASVVVEDRDTGRRAEVRTRSVINATGPYSDRVRTLANPAATSRLRVSKGVHILLPIEFLAPMAALLIPKTSDGRVIFAIPWLGRLLVGTTDDEATLETPLVVTQAEIAYLLHHLNTYLTRPATAADVVGGFAGLRPLVRSRDSRDSKKLIRDHEIETDVASGLISVLGGKWTTYRAMAEDAVDAALRQIGTPAAPAQTANHPLRGASGFTPAHGEELARTFGIPLAQAHHLAQTYGTYASRILVLADDFPDGLSPVVDGAPALRVEIVYGIRYELARTLDDIIARRIGLERFGWDHAWRAAPVVAEIAGTELGWTEVQKTDAVDTYRAKLGRLYEAAGSGPPLTDQFARTNQSRTSE